MPADKLLPDGLGEAEAVALLRHFEWQTTSFSLTFLFSDLGSASALMGWLSARLPQGIRGFEAPENFPIQALTWLDALLPQWAEISAHGQVLWVEAHRYPVDQRWNRGRRQFLSRLNERRYFLEQQVPTPMVLLLPTNFRDDARRFAPDLWHIRALSQALRRTPTVLLTSELPMQQRRAAPDAQPESGEAAWLAWQQAWAQPQHDALFLPLSVPAIQYLLACGRPADAMEVAQQAQQEARRRSNAADSLALLRNLSVSLNKVGELAFIQGDHAAAEAGFRESLALRRQLLERVGGTPEALHDVSVSLNYVGDVMLTQGDLPAAEVAYRESLTLSRQLAERLGRTPEALRDVSVSLDRVGDVARAQGDLASAEVAYRESLALGRQLLERLGGTPAALRDVSVSLDNVGDVAYAQGDLAVAEGAYRESLALRRQLLVRLGDTPEVLRDVSVSLNRVGDVARVQGDLPVAEGAYRESLELSHQLLERLGGTSEALRDVSVSLDNLGDVARAQGDLAAAEGAYRESLALSRQLLERSGGTPQAQEDTALSLMRVAALKGSDASSLRAAANRIAEDLCQRFPATPRYQKLLDALRSGDNELNSSSEPS